MTEKDEKASEDELDLDAETIAEVAQEIAAIGDGGRREPPSPHA